jgi:chemotaxis signal transduction protein
MNTQTAFPVDAFLPYMRDVDRCERSLHELNLMWRTIESSARMNCPPEARSILPAMAATRSGFAEFEAALVESLVREKMSDVQAELATKAQYLIDVMVRNLYERTADVSFLATDRELCDFVSGLGGEREAMRRRLRAYRDKYTVYEEIILLAPDGKVLVQIDETSPVECSSDPLLAATLAADHYVETFRATDLRPARREALVYSRRVCHPETGAAAGVLCLVFGFEEEMARIFQSHGAGAGRSNMLLLDGANRIIASADPLWMPPGTQVPVNRDGQPGALLFAGRKYLVRTCPSPGYQGYPGPPGWQGQVMIPLDVAFGGADSVLPAAIAPEWSSGLLTHARSFCPPLFEILAATTMIRRVVWNVQVMTAGNGGDLARLESILEQISETGRRSNDLFSRSISDLFATALASSLREAEFTSRVLVDLHDRNLYERANDCRWWALSPELRTLLAGAPPERGARMKRILDHINSLYTVYTSIFVYDRDGNVLAASGNGGVARIDDDTLARVLALRSAQDYHVSPFVPSAQYGGRPTYVFHAAIRHPGDDSAVIGGIGLVFDADVEFGAMLTGALGGRQGLQAFFIDRAGAILASTDPARPPGSRLDIDHALLATDNGSGAAGILVHDGHYAIMGCTMSDGYREFKNEDGYRADVIAVVIESFGEVLETVARNDAAPLAGSGHAIQSGVAYATFFVHGEMYAIAADDVCEALPVSRISPVAMGAWGGRAGVLALDEAPGGPGYVWVFDLGTQLSGTAVARDAHAEVLVVRRGTRAVGLMASGLHGVAKFDRADILPTSFGRADGPMLVKRVIRANGGASLIQVVDTDCLFAMLEQPQAASQSA